jgi:hypothetical protein
VLKLALLKTNTQRSLVHPLGEEDRWIFFTAPTSSGRKGNEVNEVASRKTLAFVSLILWQES